MKRARKPRPEKGALDLIEESTHRLRRLPAAGWFAYYLGSLPFVLGLLYFWSDMSRSAAAAQRLPVASLGLAVLFFWMKTWQAVFARQLRARMAEDPDPRIGLKRFLRAGVVQAAVQPSGLLVLPLALAFMVPFGWAYAFYQNLTALGDGDRAELGPVCHRAWQQAKLWPRQNHYALGAFKLFGLFVFLNLVTGFIAIPYLLKMLLGIPTLFTQSLGAVLNTTFFATMIGLTYLCIDPVVKAFYVLRCFYGESRQTGRDLRTDLRHFAPERPVALATLFLLLALVVAPAQEQAVPEPAGSGQSAGYRAPGTDRGQPIQPGISPAELDHTIHEVIGRREYAWRLPREQSPDAGERSWVTWVHEVFTGVVAWVKDVSRAVGKWISRIFRPPTEVPSKTSLSQWANRLHTFLMIVLAGLAVLLAILLMRAWMQRRTRRPSVSSQPIASTPDVADENVSADQLPEDGWLRLARELVQQGDLRLALRAYYLASLASLAARGLIALAQFKSNQEYRRELLRRNHALPEVTSAFEENVRVFDRIWYGLHDVNLELLDHFAANLHRIQVRA